MCFIEVHKSNFQKRSCAKEEVDDTFVVKSGIPLEMEKEIYAVSILYIYLFSLRGTTQNKNTFLTYITSC